MAYLGREAAKAPIVTADLPNDGVTLAKMTGGTDGQIITYDASGDPVAVGPGTDGQVLTSTGAGSPPAFEAAAGGGKVLQVLHNTSDTSNTTTSATGVTAVSHSITTANATNKVLAIATAQFEMYQESGTVQYAGFTLECTSATTVVFGPYDGTQYYGVKLSHPSGTYSFGGYYTVTKLFEPDLEGSITVTLKVHGAPVSPTNTITVNRHGGGSDFGLSQITLMEVSAS